MDQRIQLMLLLSALTTCNTRKYMRLFSNTHDCGMKAKAPASAGITNESRVDVTRLQWTLKLFCFHH